MKILALEKEVPGIRDEQFTTALLKEEARRAWELTQLGIFREISFREDRREAVIILECDSVEAANEALSSLPLMREGLIRFEVTQLLPYDGFARLFEKP